VDMAIACVQAASICILNELAGKLFTMPLQVVGGTSLRRVLGIRLEDWTQTPTLYYNNKCLCSDTGRGGNRMK